MAKIQSILIVGGSGFIGTHLAQSLREDHKVFMTTHTHSWEIHGVTTIPMKSPTREWIRKVVDIARPDIILYCAGSNDPKVSEAQPRESEGIHTNLPVSLADASSVYQPRFIYVSNGYVFEGNRGNYHESDIVLPSTLLGKHKVSGENGVRAKTFSHVVIRSSPLFGRGNGLRPTLMDQLRMKLEKKTRIELPTRELHSFAPVNGFVDLIGKVIRQGTRNRTYHYGGLSKMTQYEFGRKFAEAFGYDPNLIVPAPGVEGLFDYSLNFTQAVQDLKVEPLLLQQGFDLIKKHLVPLP